MRNKYQVIAAADGALAGWGADVSVALIKARWLADQFGQDYSVVRISDGEPIYRCNAAGGERA
jgi:hypothetical protein